MSDMSEVTVTQTNPGRVVEHRGTKSRAVRNITVDREWEVFVDGKLAGTVVYELRTRERRSGGKMYVDARWQSPGWATKSPGSYRALDAYSKADAIDSLVRNYQRTRASEEYVEDEG